MSGDGTDGVAATTESASISDGSAAVTGAPACPGGARSEGCKEAGATAGLPGSRAMADEAFAELPTPDGESAPSAEPVGCSSRDVPSGESAGDVPPARVGGTGEAVEFSDSVRESASGAAGFSESVRAQPGSGPPRERERSGTVVTVTPNPSLDRTYEIAGLARGAVQRAEADRVDPGGKGVNVSRALAADGRSTVAVLPLGGAEGALLARLLTRRGIEVAGVPVREPTRVNISLAEPDGSLTKVNAPGPQLSSAEAEALLAAAAERAAGAGASWIVCSGSLPRGLPPTWYAGLVSRVHEHGVRIALDTSGPALSAALREAPDVIKPNADELAEAVGRPLTTVGDAVKAAEELRNAGAGAVLASLGVTGQLLVEADGAYFGSAQPVPVRSDVGAGDASLAGFLGAGGAGPRALAAAVAHGLAAVQLPGSEMPGPGDLRFGDVAVTADPPLDQPLGLPVHGPVSGLAYGPADDLVDVAADGIGDRAADESAGPPGSSPLGQPSAGATGRTGAAGATGETGATDARSPVRPQRRGRHSRPETDGDPAPGPPPGPDRPLSPPLPDSADGAV